MLTQTHIDTVKATIPLLASGGTAKAAAQLVEMPGGIVSGFIFLINLFDLGGKKLLEKKYILRDCFKDYNSDYIKRELNRLLGEELVRDVDEEFKARINLDHYERKVKDKEKLAKLYQKEYMNI